MQNLEQSFFEVVSFLCLTCSKLAWFFQTLCDDFDTKQLIWDWKHAIVHICNFSHQEDVSEDEIEDVSANRAATLLYVLKQIAVSSSLCEKKALALLFHDYTEKFLDLKLVGKVLITFHNS